MVTGKQFAKRYERVFSWLEMAVAVILIFLAVNSPVIVGASASSRQLPVYCVQRDDKVVALSFDDAWGNEDTQTLIDILDSYGINTTFNAAENTPEALPGIIESLISDGYTIVPVSQILLSGEYAIDNTGRQYSK